MIIKQEDIKYNIGTEGNWLKIGIKEAIEITKKKTPILNTDEIRYCLPQKRQPY